MTHVYIYVCMYVVRVECTSRVSRTGDVSPPRSAVPGPGPGPLVNPGPLLSAVQLIILRNTTNERCRGITYTLIIWYSVCIRIIIVVLLSYSVFNFVSAIVLLRYDTAMLHSYDGTVLRCYALRITCLLFRNKVIWIRIIYTISCIKYLRGFVESCKWHNFNISVHSFR